MTYIVLILIVMVALLKFARPYILVSYFELRANKIRPAIIKYLHNNKTYWRETLEKYREGHVPTIDVFHSEEDILKKIQNIDDDLDFENKYQLLKLKFRKDKNKLILLATRYYKFWACLDFFKSAQGLNAAGQSYSGTALDFGNTKMQVYNEFKNLLNT